MILLLHSTLASSATDSLVRALQVFQSDESFALFYFGAALAGGLLALYKERPIIIFLTSFGGSFGVFVGVGYVPITPLAFFSDHLCIALLRGDRQSNLTFSHHSVYSVRVVCESKRSRHMADCGDLNHLIVVRYFDDCHITSIITHVEEEVSTEQTPDDLPECVPLHVALCVYTPTSLYPLQIV